MADSVTLATSAAQPARSASRSMTSSWIRVESTSITISRIARRSRPARWTATSTPLSTATWARVLRSDTGSAPDTSSSTQVTGSLASLVMRSMLAPSAAIPPATAATALGWSGLPSTVTCSRPRTRAEPARAGDSAEPVVISASRPKSAARSLTTP